MLGMNDGILILSLVYSCIDLSWEWELFDTCERPIHRWLIVSYACVVSFRMMHLAGTKLASNTEDNNAAAARARAAGGEYTAAAVDFLLDVRQKGNLPRLLAAFSWMIALPFFVGWTVLGSLWLHEVVQTTPHCVPSTTHLWFAGFWLTLCYVFITVHVALGAVAWMLERRVRNAEANLRAVSDDDTTSRWGSVSELSNFSSLSGDQKAGLTPDEIKALPPPEVLGEGADPAEECSSCGQECECAICINDFKNGDTVRRLPICGHTFHRSCIDLWLLRRADCPLCKRSVRST